MKTIRKENFLTATASTLVVAAFVCVLAATSTRAQEAVKEHETKAITAAEATAVWNDLMDGNKCFVSGNTRKRDVVAARAALVNGQQPKVIVLACADSRVSPELVFDQGLGELFVVRIAGNVADPDALGSMEYAVEHLHSSMIVILGHENCGAVAAAAGNDAIESPNLSALVNKIRLALSGLKTEASGDELSLLQVRANVDQSAFNVLKQSAVIRTALEEGTISLVKAVYLLKSGEVVKLSK